MVLLNLSRLLHSEVRGYWDEKLDEKLKRATLRKRWEEIDKPHDAKAELNGDAVLKQMRSLLDTGFGIKRSETQWKVHNAMMQAMLPKIFGQEFETHSGRILRSLNIKRLRQEVMVVMARRQGKSYSVGMGCAALLLLCSDVRLAVFATGKRMAAALLDITKRMIEKAWDTGAIPRKGYEIVHANQEVFHLKGPDGTERVLNVMPGTAKGWMAELVDSLEDIKHLKPMHYTIAVEEGFIDPDSDHDVENAIIFTPDAGKWCWKATKKYDEGLDKGYAHISVYWTEKSAGATISFVNPSAGKREREAAVQEAAEEGKKKKARFRDDIKRLVEDGVMPEGAAECETSEQLVRLLEASTTERIQE